MNVTLPESPLVIRDAAMGEQTRKLLNKINLSARDRLSLSLNRDGKKFVADIYGVSPYDSSKRVFASRAAAREFPMRVPERKLLDSPGSATERWEFAATETTSFLIAGLWPGSQIICDIEARTTLDYLLARASAGDVICRAMANWRADKSLPRSLHKPDGSPLVDYQHLAAWAAMTSTEGYALFMDAGTGKTPVAIETACRITDTVQGRMARVLVVVPKNVRLNWSREIEHFCRLPAKVVELRGGKIMRMKALIEGLIPSNGEQVAFVVCSYDCMKRDRDTLAAITWDLMILDESHSVKHPESQQSKVALQLRDSAQRRMILTGTPIGNSSLDLWAQLEFLGHGMSGFASWKNFRSFYGVFDRDSSGRDKLVDIQNKPFMQERLARVSFVLRKEEALPYLPQKVYDVIEVGMGPQQTKAYKSLLETLVAEIERDTQSGGNRNLVVNHMMTKLLRLAQVTSGFVQFVEEFGPDGEVIAGRAVEWFNPVPKIDALVDVLRDKTPLQKTIVWSHWVPEIKAISARLQQEGIDHVLYYGSTNDRDRKIAEDRFNCDPECRVIVGNAAAGGVGLNLVGFDYRSANPGDTNCDHIIVCSQDWSAIKRSQSEDRAHRRTTRVQVRVSDLCVPRTIDEEIRLRVVEKRMQAFEMTDLTEILRSVKNALPTGDDE